MSNTLAVTKVAIYYAVLQYRNPHYKPETVSWLSQVCNGNPYTNKMMSS